ncbi:MAG TPA: hypothetical protein VJJ24_03570 [Candidatus Paceibacterota bacterium]
MTKVISLIYIVTAVLWVILTVATNHSEHVLGLYMQILLFLVPFLGAVVGLKNASLWGGFKSAVGKAIIFLSLGTLTWSIGMLIWNYFIFIAGVEVPYPSWADAAFILSWPLWTLGVVYLSKATGVRFALQRLKGKAMLFIVPIITVIASYYLLIVVGRGGVIELEGISGLQLSFDLFYPIGSAVILAMALTFFSLSLDFLGGKYKAPIIMLIAGFLINYLSDFIFSYTTTNETYFNGHFVDFLFLTAMYFLAMSLSKMSPIANDKATVQPIT